MHRRLRGCVNLFWFGHQHNRKLLAPLLYPTQGSWGLSVALLTALPSEEPSSSVQYLRDALYYLRQHLHLHLHLRLHPQRQD